MMILVKVQEVIWASKLAIENTVQDAEVAKLLAGVGFNDKKVRELSNLTLIVEELEDKKAVRYQESFLISERIDQEANSLRPAFMDHVATVRFAFRHEAALLQSFLPKAISPNKWRWIAQAHRFYKMVLPHAAQLAPHGISQEHLEQALASIEALTSLRTNRMRKKGEAEDNTEGRNQAV